MNNRFFLFILFRIVFLSSLSFFWCLYVFDWHHFGHLHQLNVCLILLDEWAGEIQVNGQLVKTTVIGNVHTEIKKQWMSFLKTDRKEIGSLGKLGRK